MRVLVATDGSAHAERAVRLVAAQPWPDGSELRAIVVNDGHVPGRDVPGGISTVDAFDATAADLEVLANAAAQALAGPNRTSSGGVVVGRPASAIVAEAERFGADLVVLGSRGRGLLGTLTLGSVSAEVVDHAGRPVLVARGEGPIRRAVLADDGSAPAARARELLAGWPVFAATEITVVSVAHVPAPLHSAIAPTMVRAVQADYQRTVEAARAASAQVAQAAVAALQSAGRRATVEVRDGEPANEILSVARDVAADLIVVGSRGQTGLTRLLLGSVARNVLYEADGSVLVVH